VPGCFRENFRTGDRGADESMTDRGFVRNDADAAKVISLFSEGKVEGVIIGAMTFGDEVSALAVPNAFREITDLPVRHQGRADLLGRFAGSDSFCGSLSISSGLQPADIPLFLAAIVFPEEKGLTEILQNFHGDMRQSSRDLSGHIRISRARARSGLRPACSVKKR